MATDIVDHRRHHRRDNKNIERVNADAKIEQNGVCAAPTAKQIRPASLLVRRGVSSSGVVCHGFSLGVPGYRAKS